MATDTTELKVISWNVNGLKEKLKSKDNFSLLLNTFGEFDIVLLQETHLGKKNKNKEKLVEVEMDGEDEDDEEQGESENEEENTDVILPNYDNVILQDKTCLKLGLSHKPKIYKTHFDSRSRGVAILVNKAHNCLKAYSEGGDFAWIYTEIDNQKYTFVSVYYKMKENSDLMWRILCSFRIHGPEAWIQSRLVIGGDFNTTLNAELDLVGENPKHNARRKTLNDFIRIVFLADVWRTEHTNERKYTYSCQKCISRLDYVFMLQEELQNVIRCDIPVNKPQFRELSDHFPVVLTLHHNNSD